MRSLDLGIGGSLESFCQLNLTSSVNRLRMLNRLDRVPPLPTSLIT